MAPLFPVNNVWNIAVDSLSPSRALDVTNDHAGHPFHPDFGEVFTGTTLLNGIPINYVAGDSATPVAITVTTYWSESDELPGGDQQSGFLPIPPGVLIEGDPVSDPGWTSGADHHLILIDTDTNTLHELYQAIRVGAAITAVWYGRWDLSTNDLRHDFWTSGDAAGLPVQPGLVDYDEVQDALAIDATGATVNLGHALRFTLDLTHGPHLWPARHDANSGGTSNPPFGLRVRLKSSYSSSGFSPTNKVIINTLKKYGAFLADNGGDWYFQGTPNSGWDDDDLHLLADILPSDDMEVVDILDWQVFADSAEADVDGNGLPALPYPRADKVLALDFDNPTAVDTAPGWTSFPLDIYRASPGYGWSVSFGTDYRTRTGTDPLWKDITVANSSGESIFRIDLASGEYVVTLFLGDPENLHNEDLVVTADGVTKLTLPYTVSGEQRIESFLVTVSGGYLLLGFSVSSGGSLAIAGLEVDPVPSLSLVDTGSGNDRTVTITCEGQFKLVFDAGDNWGLSEWYDLVHDPDSERNLTGPGFGNETTDNTTSEPGLFNQAYYGTTPNDPKTFTRAAYTYFPSSARSFEIIENTPTQMHVASTCHPVSGSDAVLTDITVRVDYVIRPDGSIRLTCRTTSTSGITIGEWRNFLGLQNPGHALGTSPPDITGGWVRASATQNPYSYDSNYQTYLFAYWDTPTPPPNTNFAKASALLVPKTGNASQGNRFLHTWSYWVRWGYSTDPTPLTIGAGQSVTQHYLIQLGTEDSLFLPDIKTIGVADPIAAAYHAETDAVVSSAHFFCILL